MGIGPPPRPGEHRNIHSTLKESWTSDNNIKVITLAIGLAVFLLWIIGQQFVGEYQEANVQKEEHRQYRAAQIERCEEMGGVPVTKYHLNTEYLDNCAFPH